MGCHQDLVDFPGGLVPTNLPAHAGDSGLIPGSGRSPGEGNGNPLQYSCPGNPMDFHDRSLAGYSPWGHKRVRHNWVTRQQNNNPCLPSHPISVPWKTQICSLLYSFVLLRTSYKWNPTVCNLSRLPFLTKLHASTLLCVDNSSPFIAEQYYLVQRYQSLFNHSPREGHLCFFPCFGHGSICCKHLWASSCVNISFHFSGINDQEWNCGLHGKCMFTLMRSCQIIFQSSWTILHSRQ